MRGRVALAWALGLSPRSAIRPLSRMARRFRARFRGRGDGHGRREHVQAGGRAPGSPASDLRSPREEAGMEPARQDRRAGLDQGEDMAAADGASLRLRLGILRLARMIRDGDATLCRLCVELSEKWRALLCRRRRDVPWTNSAAERGIGRSEIRRKTARGYKREDGTMNGFGPTQWAWSGRDGLDMSEPVVALRRAVRWGICALRNPPKDDQPFMGRLRDSPAPDKRRLGNVHCRAGDCHA